MENASVFPEKSVLLRLSTRNKFDSPDKRMPFLFIAS